jgi:hypothetical protein
VTAGQWSQTRLRSAANRLYIPGATHIAADTYRVICRIDDTTRTVTVVDVGHRRDVYHT